MGVDGNVVFSSNANCKLIDELLLLLPPTCSIVSAPLFRAVPISPRDYQEWKWEQMTDRIQTLSPAYQYNFCQPLILLTNGLEPLFNFVFRQRSEASLRPFLLSDFGTSHDANFQLSFLEVNAEHCT